MAAAAFAMTGLQTLGVDMKVGRKAGDATAVGDGRGRLGLAVLAAAIAVAVAGGAAGSSWLLGYAQGRYHVAAASADVHTDLNRLDDLSGDMAAASPPPAPAVAEATMLEHRIGVNLALMERSGFEPHDLMLLGDQIRANLDSVEHVALLSSQGDLAGAKAQDTGDELAFEDVSTKTFEEVGELRAAADDATRDVKRGLLGLAALVIGLIVGVLLWDGRRRRRFTQQQAESQSRARFEAMVEQGSDLLLLTDVHGNQTYASPGLEHLLGYPIDSPAARHLSELVDTEDRVLLGGLLEQAVASTKAGPADLRLRHSDGSWRTMEVAVVDLCDVSEVGAVLWTAHDVTDRRQLERELERSAFRDSLTGLANRALFRDRVVHALSRTVRSGHPIAVLLADLDGFKLINDSLGHDAGDRVLVEMAARLADCVRPGDTVARMGGDEFTILLEDAVDSGFVETVADRVLTIVRQPMTIAGTEVRLGISVGIAYSLAGQETAQDMVRNADVAMYAAKNQGRGRRATYDVDLHADAEAQLRLSNDLDGALRRGELEVHYQPTFSLATNSLEGTEALLRWHHPQLGVIAPSVFIPLAEQSGQILPIGRWVLEQACRQAKIWQTDFPSAQPRSMCINLSGLQFAEPDLVADVVAVIRDTGVNPKTIVLEITESVLMHDVENVITRLHQLKELGVRLAIDDFGTGYSSLGYLSQFPVDILKIDRSFVEAATSGAAGGDALVRTIIDLSANLHLSTIAEGIEHRAQAEHMLGLGCTTGQGYLFGRPMSAQDLTQLLDEKSAELIGSTRQR
jgi:diguanylate cyclase (GGDEF)-like protein/PAS domain S-box-containing protein